MDEKVVVIFKYSINIDETTNQIIKAIQEYDFIAPNGEPIKKSIINSNNVATVELSLSRYMSANMDSQNFAGNLGDIISNQVHAFEDAYGTNILSNNYIDGICRFIG